MSFFRWYFTAFYIFILLLDGQQPLAAPIDGITTRTNQSQLKITATTCLFHYFATLAKAHKTAGFPKLPKQRTAFFKKPECVFGSRENPTNAGCPRLALPTVCRQAVSEKLLGLFGKAAKQNENTPKF